MVSPEPTGAAANENETLSVRDRLLNAAERVVGRDGAASFTLEAVAAEAGVSKGGLLYHFPSKSALITAIVDRLAARCETDQAQAMSASGDGPGAFTRAYLTIRTDPLDPQAELVHTALLAAAGTNAQFLEPFRNKLKEWQARLQDDGIEPETAMIVRLAIDGICLCQLLGMPVPEGELRNRVMERLLAMTRPADKHDNQERQS